MPRYFFNVHDGMHLIPGRDSLEFDDLAAAECAAALTAAELGLGQVQKSGSTSHQVVIEIRDECREQMAMVMWKVGTGRPILPSY